jgi:hypothetical protein
LLDFSELPCFGLGAGLVSGAVALADSDGADAAALV